MVQTLTEIRQLLLERGLSPRHRLGQNFLHDKNQLAKLIEAANIQPTDLVLEVGPGTGTLTETLLEHGAQVVACEIDPGLAALLRDRQGAKITLIEGDALAKGRALNPDIVDAIGGRAFKLVANLPYQIASPLISTLLIDHPSSSTGGCIGQFITIQKEVADRLIAQPSSKEYGALSIIVQTLARIERISVLSPGCFWPPPEVTSAMIAVIPKPDAEVPIDRSNARAFAQFVTDLFSKRRKQIGTIFGRARPEWEQVAEHAITPDQRPEALTPAQMSTLFISMTSRS